MPILSLFMEKSISACCDSSNPYSDGIPMVFPRNGLGRKPPMGIILKEAKGKGSASARHPLSIRQHTHRDTHQQPSNRAPAYHQHTHQQPTTAQKFTAPHALENLKESRKPTLQSENRALRLRLSLALKAQKSGKCQTATAPTNAKESESWREAKVTVRQW